MLLCQLTMRRLDGGGVSYSSPKHMPQESALWVNHSSRLRSVLNVPTVSLVRIGLREVIIAHLLIIEIVAADEQSFSLGLGTPPPTPNDQVLAGGLLHSPFLQFVKMDTGGGWSNTSVLGGGHPPASPLWQGFLVGPSYTSSGPGGYLPTFSWWLGFWAHKTPPCTMSTGHPHGCENRLWGWPAIPLGPRKWLPTCPLSRDIVAVGGKTLGAVKQAHLYGWMFDNVEVCIDILFPWGRCSAVR